MAEHFYVLPGGAVYMHIYSGITANISYTPQTNKKTHTRIHGSNEVLLPLFLTYLQHAAFSGNGVVADLCEYHISKGFSDSGLHTWQTFLVTKICHKLDGSIFGL